MIKVISIDKEGERLKRLEYWERGERRKKDPVKIKNGFNSVLSFILLVAILVLCAYLISIIGGSYTDYFCRKP